MNHDRAIPILPSRDLKETVDFYQKLGFTNVSGSDYQDIYGIMCRGSLELHFIPIPEFAASESYAGCYLRVTHVDALFEEFQSLRLPSDGIPRLGAIANRPWGMREFYIVDPSGNLLRIGQETTEMR